MVVVWLSILFSPNADITCRCARRFGAGNGQVHEFVIRFFAL
jgi:hypothetical protein